MLKTNLSFECWIEVNLSTMKDFARHNRATKLFLISTLWLSVLSYIKIDIRNIKEIESNTFNIARTIQGIIVGSVAIGFFVFAIAVVIEGSSMARL